MRATRLGLDVKVSSNSSAFKYSTELHEKIPFALRFRHAYKIKLIFKEHQLCGQTNFFNGFSLFPF